MFLIDDILLAPLNGVIWLGKKINEVAEREFSDEGLIKEKLMEVQMKFEMDKISEKEYNKQEADLLARLDAISKAKEEEV
ncbi:MAG: gas vesicle protein GvpG [Candidatus Omnitrophota bacterium]|nr:gas vesicle protein GvpG [Candidatus Omnitrophota bacterium]